jgi:hypothetical protein
MEIVRLVFVHGVGDGVMCCLEGWCEGGLCACMWFYKMLGCPGCGIEVVSALSFKREGCERRTRRKWVMVLLPRRVASPLCCFVLFCAAEISTLTFALYIRCVTGYYTMHQTTSAIMWSKTFCVN